MPTPPADDPETLDRAAREAGLERLLELDRDALARARTLAAGYAARLRRPAAPHDEPAHVYRPRPAP